jgi:hypothetical protein
MRKFREHVRGEAEALQDAASCVSVSARAVRGWRSAFQRAADGHARRQRRDGILQQQLRAPAEGEGRSRELLAHRPVADLHHARRWRREPHEHSAQRALSRSGFAHQPDDLAFADGERDVVEGAHPPVEQDAYACKLDECGAGAHWTTFALRAPVFALGAALRAHGFLHDQSMACADLAFSQRRHRLATGVDRMHAAGANTHALRTSTGSGTSLIETSRPPAACRRARRRAARVRMAWARRTSATGPDSTMVPWHDAEVVAELRRGRDGAMKTIEPAKPRRRSSSNDTICA